MLTDINKGPEGSKVTELTKEDRSVVNGELGFSIRQ